MKLASYIDHTVLKPTTTNADVLQVCDEALALNMAAVCIPPPFVAWCKDQLKESNVKVATVIGFPFGYSATEAKLAELIKAIEAGVDEVDIVHNISAVKNANWDYLFNEARILIEAAHHYKKIIKIILETSELADEEIAKCCELYIPLSPEFLKTSTGYASGGATIHAVSLLRKLAPQNIQIKASGGIRDRETAINMINAGATRLGCSASLKILGIE